MKGLFTSAILLALGFIGYIAYPSAIDFFRSKDWLPPAKAGSEAGPPPDGGAATTDRSPAAGTGPEAAPEPVAGQPVAPEKPAPRPVEPNPPVVASEDEVARLIPMPNIKSLEEITASWTNVPQRAFPPVVTLRSDVAFELVQGNSMTVPAGREVSPVALAADGTLTVAPRPDSIIKATIPVDQTDFKERVTARYNEGVERIKAGVEVRRNKERQRLAAAAVTSEDVKSKAGDVPKSSDDEQRYLALMKESVANGELKDVTPDKVKSWRWLGYEEVSGTGYWTGAAIITKSTYFGDFETEAKAYIRQGRVEKWTLPGVED